MIHLYRSALLVAVTLATPCLAQDALEAFAQIHQVAIGDRCANCHTTALHPRQYGGKPHLMNVTSSLNHNTLGVKCTTCHRDSNQDTPYTGSPPGAPKWHMPPTAMRYEKDISPSELCDKWKQALTEDGGDFKEKVVKHLQDDKLVRWTWQPGGPVKGAVRGLQQKYVRTASTGSHAQFMELVKTWVDGGAPCP